ncbi:chemotaxis protein CheW [uncultured Massilia sp.]|uniref:chemotaxis protein CheW n=1 Tax=uncultured Massilia sp. TaxID=169973 RepID=UPI0025FAFBF4|nr:chemotaxis protein CheW [uncultured Massilia sp.]
MSAMDTTGAIDPGRDDCWRRIGVSGDRSCPELERHAHCRHCPVYAQAAQRSLQRPVDQGYRDAWARELARQAPPAPHTDSAAMAFRIGHEWLAAPLALAASVAPLAPVHRLPHRSRGALLGIVNVGGRLLPAVSLARLLEIDAAAPPPLGRHAFPRLLVLSTGAHGFALPVDEVHGVLRHAAADMRPAAATVGHAPSPLLAGVIRDSALEAGLLDAARLRERLEGLLR